MVDAAQNVMQYVVAVVAVAVISRVVNQYKILQGTNQQKNLIRGFLTFFAVSLCYFPVSLMMGGISYRNEFFNRESSKPLVVRA